MSNLWLHPALPLLLGAIIAVFAPKRTQKFVILLASLFGLLCAMLLPMGTELSVPFINGMTLLVLRVDMLSRIMILSCTFVVLCANIYGFGQVERPEGCWSLLYAASACGALLAGDFVTLIFWWELMAVGAAFMLSCRKDKGAARAGFRYLMVHFFGGNLLLFGIILLISQGQFLLGPLARGGPAYWLVLAGLGVSAGMLPFHSWVPDAYPEASASGSVIMSGLTTKVAAMTLLRLFAGEPFLLIMGIAMAFWGVFYALRENNIRRLLSYHIISQLGLIIASIGIGTPLACNAAVALTIGNIIYKGLLYMSTGATCYATGRQKLTELGGMFRAMPANGIFFLIGGLAISGIPGLMGFAVKPLVVTSAIYAYMPTAELLLYAAGIGTFLSIPLKLGYHMLWGGHPAPPILRKPTKMMYAGMAILTAVILVIGVQPHLLYQYLPWTAEVHFNLYTADHILSELEFLLAAFVAFWLLRPVLKPKAAISLDLDWFYRVPLPRFCLQLSHLINFIRLSVWGGILRVIKATLPFFRNPVRRILQSNGGKHPDDFNADTYRQPLGVGALAILVVFVAAYFYIMLI